MKTLKTKRGTMEGVKPFKLVKYLSLSSLMVVLVCTVLLSSFISQRAKAILFQKSEQYALLVAENLNHQVFFQFTVPTLITDGEIRLSRESQYERLDKVVRNTIHGFAVESVNIYDPAQILSYSTNREKVGTKVELGNIFERALLREQTISLMTEDKKFPWYDWRTGPRKLKTYLPMWEEKSLSWKRGKVLGVFEITQDVTRDYETIQRFRWLVILGFLLFVGILFFTLLIIARRAEKIIAARSLERQRLEEQLHQSERLAALGEMIAGVSHEIRNPLGIIRSTAELLHTRIESERQKRLSGIIVEEATRLNDILTEFLDFARPKNLRPIPGAVEDVLDRNIQVIEAELQKVGVVVTRDYQTGHFIFEADFDLLYRAFINLFANALQAMPEGGALFIGTTLVHPNGSSPQVEVTIRDTGPGISPEVRGKVFNPFFTTREKGTGLGLAIVKNIVDSHGGEIDIQSKEGEGTAIIVRLPVARAEPSYEMHLETATA